MPSTLKKILRKLKSGSYYPFYYTMYHRLGIRKRQILLESRRGLGVEGNIYALLCTLLTDQRYRGHHIIVALQRGKEKQAKLKLQRKGLPLPRFVTVGSLSYYAALSSSGYLFNDTTFPGRFAKKEGQIYVNVWHGTPLKKMGKDNPAERGMMGNVMRNLLMADYLLFPNRFMQEKMSEAYDLAQLYRGTLLHAGYPRNDVFFQSEKERETKRRELGFSSYRQVIAYLPTYRGLSDHVEREETFRKRSVILHALDQGLRTDQRMLVRLHPFEGEALTGETYSHILPFPEGTETYEVLSACDVLITDYSSVCFDFAVSGRPAACLAYDWEEYETERGLYLKKEEVPFPVFKTVEEVLSWLEKQTVSVCDPTYYKSRYATWENGSGARDVLSAVIKGSDVNGEEGHCEKETFCPQKQNILWFPGNLERNGITSSFLELFPLLDHDRFHHIVSFRYESVKNDLSRLDPFPEGVSFFPIASEANLDPVSAAAQAVFLKTGFTGLGVGRRLERLYREEWQKQFGKASFAHLMQYNGYENYTTALFRYASFPYTIWAHNDMEREIREKRNPSPYVLRAAYTHAAHVVGVGSNACVSARNISGREISLCKIHNCLNRERILARAAENLQFQEDTKCTVSFGTLTRLLAQFDPGQIKEDRPLLFVNIGRYSNEKGQDLLIEAFTLFWLRHPSSCLIMMGGAGKDYEKLCSLAADSEAKDHIIFIYSLRNPMPILSKADLFILSSRYEGYPVSSLEAAVLRIPCLGTEVPGTKEQFETYGGYLVPCTTEGLLEGMEAFLRGEVGLLAYDSEEEKNKTVAAIEQLMT
ncbi:MAG: CDP-glycerol glycerophosphotransferase family protein [Blautia sp.]|nr:CDP-glycerol glycerophosphotransferase family protein [Blautia sp.]